MTNEQLLIFKTVVEKGSFSAAAKHLFMTQSSVSQQIQNLESCYGVKLFDRFHRRISLTQAGEALYPYAVEIDRLHQEAGKAMQGIIAETSGRLKVGASLTIGEYLMPEILVAFSRIHPKVDIAMDVYNTEQITAMVVKGDVQLGFVEGPYEAPPIIVNTPCGGDRLLVIAPPGHHFAKLGTISLNQLFSERWVMREPTSGTRRVFEQYLNCHNYDASALNIVMELGSTQAVKEAVKAGLGISAISCLAVAEEIARREVDVINLSEGAITRVFTMLLNREKFQTRAVEKFKEFFAVKAREILDRKNPNQQPAE